jgi:hypothetical protein
MGARAQSMISPGVALGVMKACGMARMWQQRCNMLASHRRRSWHLAAIALLGL